MTRPDFMQISYRGRNQEMVDRVSREFCEGDTLQLVCIPPPDHRGLGAIFGRFSTGKAATFNSQAAIDFANAEKPGVYYSDAYYAELTRVGA